MAIPHPNELVSAGSETAQKESGHRVVPIRWNRSGLSPFAITPEYIAKYTGRMWLHIKSGHQYQSLGPIYPEATMLLSVKYQRVLMPGETADEFTYVEFSRDSEEFFDGRFLLLDTPVPSGARK